MRIPVSLVINLVAHGKTAPDIISEYTDLTPEDISQSLEYMESQFRFSEEK